MTSAARAARHGERADDWVFRLSTAQTRIQRERYYLRWRTNRWLELEPDEGLPQSLVTAMATDIRKLEESGR